MDINNSKYSGSRQTSVFVPDDLWKLAKQNFIEFKTAMIFGIRFLLADNDEDMEFEYPKNKLSEKLKNVTRLLNEKCMEIERLKNPVDAEKETDELFGGVIDGSSKE